VWAKNVTLENAPPSLTRIGPAEIYPDSTRTPGLANPDITQDNIADNLCNPTWSTKTIRPPHILHGSAQADTDARMQRHPSDPNAACMLSSNNKGCYEEDHLISPENGGDHRDPRNLWPEPYKTTTRSALMFPVTRATVLLRMRQ